MLMSKSFVCVDCGATGEQSPRGRTRLRCDGCRALTKSYEVRKVQFPKVDCAGCGQSFRAHHRTQRWCSMTCGNRNKARSGFRGGLTPEAKERQRLYWQEKGRRRRAIKRGSAAEPYTLAEIAERDGECCGLCGTPVPMGVRVPDPLAPTIDHVVPISRGGNDTRANVQLAHFRCNSVKGAREIDRVAPAG